MRHVDDVDRDTAASALDLGGLAIRPFIVQHPAAAFATLQRWVADASPHKQGKYLPGSRIPIVEPARIAAEKPDYVLVLPWNLLHEVSQQLAQVRQWDGRFVIAVPELSVL